MNELDNELLESMDGNGDSGKSPEKPNTNTETEDDFGGYWDNKASEDKQEATDFEIETSEGQEDNTSETNDASESVEDADNSADDGIQSMIAEQVREMIKSEEETISEPAMQTNEALETETLDEIVEVESVDEVAVEEKKKNTGKILVIAGACVLVALIIVLIATLTGGSNTADPVAAPTTEPQPAVETTDTPETAPRIVTPYVATDIFNETKFVQFLNYPVDEFSTRTGVHCKRSGGRTDLYDYSSMSSNPELEISEHGYKVYEDEVFALYFNNLYGVMNDSIGVNSEGTELRSNIAHLVFIIEPKVEQGTDKTITFNIKDIEVNNSSAHTSASTTFNTMSCINTIMLIDNGDVNTNGIYGLKIIAAYDYDGSSKELGALDLYPYANDLYDLDLVYNNMVQARTEKEAAAVQEELENMYTIQRANNGGFTDSEMFEIYENIVNDMELEGYTFDKGLENYFIEHTGTDEDDTAPENVPTFSDLASDILKKAYELNSGENMVYSGNNKVINVPAILLHNHGETGTTGVDAAGSTTTSTADKADTANN